MPPKKGKKRRSREQRARTKLKEARLAEQVTQKEMVLGDIGVGEERKVNALSTLALKENNPLFVDGGHMLAVKEGVFVPWVTSDMMFRNFDRRTIQEELLKCYNSINGRPNFEEQHKAEAQAAIARASGYMYLSRTMRGFLGLPGGRLVYCVTEQGGKGHHKGKERGKPLDEKAIMVRKLRATMSMMDRAIGWDQVALARVSNPLH